MRARVAFLLLLVALGLGAVRPAHAAATARLELAGSPLASAEGEALLQPALRAPADSAALARSLDALLARMQSGGWLDARVAAAWRGDSAERVLAAKVSAGSRYRWGALALDVPREDSAAVAAALAWTPGAPASPPALTAAVARVVDAAVADGHAWASFGVTGWTPDSAGTVGVRVTGTRGPRVTVGEVRIEGLHVTRPDVAQRALGRLAGLAYNPAATRAATARLEALGIFRHVEPLGLAGLGDSRRGVLRWRVEEPRYNTFEGAVGVQGSAGAVGLARLELGNLLGTARAMSLSWQSRGKGLVEFGARYVEPMLFGRALRWEASLQQQIQDTSYTRFRWGTRARVALGERLGAEAAFDVERVVQTQGEVRDADVQNTSFALERDARDEARAPRRGTFARLEATQAFTRQTLRPVPGEPVTGRDATGGALQWTGEWHRPLGRATGLALETRAAARFSSESVLSDWERWPVGGSASLRGHDEEEFRVDRYALSRFEWRFFLAMPGQRAALFWDHAHLETRLAAPAGGTRRDAQEADGLGVGLRLPAAGGDVDLDYGLAPGRGVLEGKIHLRLVTAF